MKQALILVFIFVSQCLSAQGPYAPAAGQAGTTAIHKDSSLIVSWASASVIERGWQDVADTTKGKTTTGNNISPTGKSGVNGVASLGDGGSVTLTFDGVINDGFGADFVVFENAVANFLELAFVEVSSDGINFFRFDAVSLTDTAVQVGSFGTLDPTNLYNLAGKYEVNYGVPFDLNELAGTNGLDINNVSHVKIIDVIGNISESYTTHDSQGNKVNDPYPTDFNTGGFDVDAVGVINYTPTSINEINPGIVSGIFPNPTQDKINLTFSKDDTYFVEIFDLMGNVVLFTHAIGTKLELHLSPLNAGVYYVAIKSEQDTVIRKIVKQ